MDSRYFQHTFSNGLTLLAEHMPAVQSAAMTLLIPAGASSDPSHHLGSATVLADLVLRGAGDRDNKKLTNDLDRLGLQRASGVGVHHSRFSCAAVASRVLESFPIYADIIRRPHLPQSGFDSARDLALQALAGVDDDPRQKLLIRLRERFLPDPLGRNPMGDAEQLKKLTLDDVRADHHARYQAPESILAVAGNVDFAQLTQAVEKYFGDFTGSPPVATELKARMPGAEHEKQKSEQTHIGIAYPAVRETDPSYYTARAAVEILGGGASGRLFTEVREKRGLCYSVWAGYTSLKGAGAILAYAGSSNDRAQAALDCMLEQIHRLQDGVTEEELHRAKIGLKAATIMMGESTSSRAGAIAHDFFMRGRIRTLDEVKSEIDAVTLDGVRAFLKKHPPGPFTIVMVGPKKLKTPI